MTTSADECWPDARGMFHECFQFWPDHEDIIWAKSIWPRFFHRGLYADHGEEAEAWSKRNVLALSMLYAGSAIAFGTPDMELPEHFDKNWMIVNFGSRKNLDERLFEVGTAVCSPFSDNGTFEGNPGFFIPMIKSFVCGSGFYREGPKLDAYLARVEACHFEQCEFREDNLRRMWSGGNFSADELCCF